MMKRSSYQSLKSTESRSTLYHKRERYFTGNTIHSSIHYTLSSPKTRCIAAHILWQPSTMRVKDQPGVNFQVKLPDMILPVVLNSASHFRATHMSL